MMKLISCTHSHGVADRNAPLASRCPRFAWPLTPARPATALPALVSTHLRPRRHLKTTVHTILWPEIIAHAVIGLHEHNSIPDVRIRVDFLNCQLRGIIHS